MSDLPLELLACPRCAHALARHADSFRCASCGTEFPSLDGIPWLFADPAASLGEWRDRLHRLLLELQRQADEIRAQLDAPDLLTSTRSRLKLLAQAWADHARRLQSLLAPLSLDTKQASLEMQLALRTRLPPSQDLASYYVNLHRDWVWGDAENQASHQLIAQALESEPLGRTLVLGAGACRLAYDLHRSHRPACTVAADINPLLLLTAARAQTLIESAQKESEVVVYGANLNDTMDPMHRAFEKKYGVAVKYWRGASTALATRATGEWRSGRPEFDVVQGNRGLQLIMAREGLFTKHVTPSLERFPERFRDPEGLLSPMSFLPIGILYNRDDTIITRRP